MKTCPFCAEEIQDAAIKCRHCGSMLAPLPGDAGGTRPAAAANGSAATIFRGSPSWKAQFWSMVAAVLLVVVGLFAAPFAHSAFGVEWSPALIGSAATLVLGGGWWLMLWAARATLRYHVTSRAIDVESGLLSKNIETLQLWKVRDIEFHQTLTDRLLGAARIRVFTQDVTSPQFILWGLPGSRQLFEQLKEAIEIARQSRNVIGVVD